MSTFDTLVPADGPPDMRGIHRFAMSQARTARRPGDVRKWRRLARKALRSLRYAAFIEALRVPGDPPCSPSLFSETPEKPFEPLAPTIEPGPDRRRPFPDDRLRC